MIIILVSVDGQMFTQIADTFETIDDAIVHAKDIEGENKFVSVEEQTAMGSLVHYQTGAS